MTDITSLQSDLLAQIAAAGDEAALEAVRVAALGKKGAISELMKTLGGMSPEDRKVQGPLLNGLRDAVTEAIARKKTSLGDAALEARLASETIDVTLPPRPENAGTVHPISQVLEEVTAGATTFRDWPMDRGRSPRLFHCCSCWVVMPYLREMP